jgi:hypothetical protein
MPDAVQRYHQQFFKNRSPRQMMRSEQRMMVKRMEQNQDRNIPRPIEKAISGKVAVRLLGHLLRIISPALINQPYSHAGWSQFA